MGKNTSHYAHCLTLMTKHRQHHMRHSIIISGLCIVNGYIHIITMPIRYQRNQLIGWLPANPLRMTGFILGVFAIFLSLMLVALAWLGSPGKPRLFAASIGIIVIGELLGTFNTIIGIAMFILCMFMIPDYKEEEWVKKQPGYPLFNEHYDEAMRTYGKVYKPDHKLDGVAGGTMQDVYDTAAPEQTRRKAQILPTDAAQAAYAVVQGSRPDEMPEILTEELDILSEAPDGADIRLPESRKPKLTLPKQEKAARLPDLPRADDIPDPVWNVPEPDTDIPDPVWNAAETDTGDALVISDVPDIAGDIPDLPEIPDIPQL